MDLTRVKDLLETQKDLINLLIAERELTIGYAASIIDITHKSRTLLGNMQLLLNLNNGIVTERDDTKPINDEQTQIQIIQQQQLMNMEPSESNNREGKNKVNKESHNHNQNNTNVLKVNDSSEQKQKRKVVNRININVRRKLQLIFDENQRPTENEYNVLQEDLGIVKSKLKRWFAQKRRRAVINEKN